jgi:diadenylate cyclase
MEKDIKLGETIQTGTAVDSKVTAELLEQIFIPNTPLHDGAVIIRKNRIVAASCFLPLTGNTTLNKELGTRHRSAIGITEISDCITVVVSEETGKISIAKVGSLVRNYDKDSLVKALKSYLIVENSPRKLLPLRKEKNR